MPTANPVFDMVAAVAACLCEQINDTVDLPGVCFCGVVPGDIAAAAYSGDCEDDTCGMAWVRLVTLYPAVGVGQVDARAGNCSAGLGMEMELGIMRCLDIAENIPNPEELLRTSQLQYADALAMFRAIFCCTAIPNKDAIVSSYTPTGPEGGMVGGILSVAVAL